MPGTGVAQPPDRLGEDVRPAVGQVVTGDAGDDDVLEAERRDGLGDPSRLVVVEPGGPAGLDRAEAAGPGARVAEDHDRGGALVPALPDVRAVGLLADRVQVQAAQQALQVVVVVAGRDPRPDPVGVAAERQWSRRRPARPARHPARSTASRAGTGVTVAAPERAGPRRRVEHRELAGHGWECTVAGQLASRVSRRPSSSPRATKPSSAAALASTPSR